jgi:hypothetical protein
MLSKHIQTCWTLLLLTACLLNGILGLTVELARVDDTNYLLTMALPNQNMDLLSIEFVPNENLPTSGPYHSFLQQLTHKKGVVDMYSWNGCLKKITENVLQLQSSLAATAKEVKQHLNYLAHGNANDKLNVFVIDFRGTSKSYLGEILSDNSYTIDPTINEASELMQQLFQDVQLLQTIENLGTTQCGQQKFQMSNNVQFTSEKTAIITCTNAKSGQTIVDTSKMSLFFFDQGKTIKLKKGVFDTTLFATLQHLLSGHEQVAAEQLFFISEGGIKQDLLKVLAAVGDLESVRFLDTQPSGKDALCYIGEIIMNAHKMGMIAKVSLNGVVQRTMTGADYFYHVKPPTAHLSFDHSSGHGQQSTSTLSHHPLVNFEGKSLTTIYQHGYESIYGKGGIYAQIIEPVWKYTLTTGQHGTPFSIEIFP